MFWTSAFSDHHLGTRFSLAASHQLQRSANCCPSRKQWVKSCSAYWETAVTIAMAAVHPTPSSPCCQVDDRLCHQPLPTSSGTENAPHSARLLRRYPISGATLCGLLKGISTQSMAGAVAWGLEKESNNVSPVLAQPYTALLLTSLQSLGTFVTQQAHTILANSHWIGQISSHEWPCKQRVGRKLSHQMPSPLSRYHECQNTIENSSIHRRWSTGNGKVKYRRLWHTQGPKKIILQHDQCDTLQRSRSVQHF